MAEQIDSSTEAPDSPSTSTDLSAKKRLIARRRVAKVPASTTSARVARARRPRPAGKAHPVRSFVTIAAVAGLFATVAIPAVFSGRGETAEAVTLQQVALDNAQQLVVASETEVADLDRDSYAATTEEEILKKKREEAAKKALAARLASSRKSSSSSSAYSGSVAASIAASGEVVRPLTSFRSFGTPYAGHKGTDYMAARGTPIYSIADGVVVASTDNGPGWGVYVKVAHNIGGTSVTSLYAHMGYGTRRVSVGQSVSAGQLLGQVSDTGRANGTHLHLEIRVGGGYVNAESWLRANAN